MKKLYAVSHTEVNHHVENKVGGWLNSDLTEKGISGSREQINLNQNDNRKVKIEWMTLFAQESVAKGRHFAPLAEHSFRTIFLKL